MSADVRITWVNHAGFILRCADAVILCDPWISGAVFNNGWELLVPTNLDGIELADITHIWFSHEHPDHFNPGSLRQILPAIGEVEILFQETHDKRLVEYFQKQGKTVREMGDRQPVRITAGTTLTVGKNGIEDSWALVETNGLKVLNLNDCIFNSKAEISALAADIGAVDVLLSQFSYAEKVGERDEAVLRSAASRHYRDLLLAEANAFAAKFVIPFASFKYWSHQENFYLNKGASTAALVFESIEGKIPGTPVLLFPGDVWDYGAANDNAATIRRYAHYEQNIQPVEYADKALDMDRLTALSADFVDKLGALYRDSRSNLFKLMCRLPFPGGLPRIKIWLTDIGCGGVLRADRPFRQTDIARKNCDIELSSPNLGYLYQHFSGANALIVNGRYTATRTGRYKLFVLSHLALMASANVRLSLAYVGENLVKIMSNILRRLTKV